MLTANKKSVLALTIFTFAFMYRLALMLSNTFPPGADIGLHNSVIYSITGSGQTDFLYNFYHIGGGLSLTFPGYHIFTAGVIMLTGMTGAMEPVAHALVVSLFSSLTVLGAFLLTRRIWSTSAAYIVAFLTLISRFDIEMTMWAGYPNVVTLLLIPLVFYLYLEKDRFSIAPFLVSTSILVAALFLTHSLSAAIFGVIAVATLTFVMVSPKTVSASRKTILYWLLPIIIGAVLVLPFLLQAIPAYLSDNAYLNGSAGSSDIGSATLSARVLPLSIVLPLFGLIPAFLIFAKRYYKRWLTLPTFLLCVWVFVCLALTQGYLVKIPFDYNRFLYFLILPLLIFMAVLIDYTSDSFARIIDTYRTLTGKTQTAQKKIHRRIDQVSSTLTRKNLYSIFILFFLVSSFVALPIFATPAFSEVGLSLQKFYQTMTTEGWDAMQWAKQNTPSNAVFVSDALYGWWLGGFAQRPTLSAVDPQYLSLNREMDNATFARNILDTDYIIDNNSTMIPQVRDDGGYIARHNPQILVRQNWTYYPSSFFNFNSNGTTILYYFGEEQQPIISLDKLPVKEMRLEKDPDHASIIVVRGNEDLNYTVTTTVNRGIRFVTVTSTLIGLRSDIGFDFVEIHVETKENQIAYNDEITAAFVDVGTKSFGQLIFTTKPNSTYPEESKIQLTYLLGGKSQGQIQILATAYSESNIEAYYSSPEAIEAYFTPIITANMANALEPIKEPIQLEVFNYSNELQARSVAYIACRDAEVYHKFREDPLFSLVFINKGVAIFKVHGNLK